MGGLKSANGGISKPGTEPARRARGHARLSDAQLKAVRPGDKPLYDGRGMYFVPLDTPGVSSIRLGYRDAERKEQTYVIGRYPDTGLSEARKQNDDARSLIRAGLNPTLQKKALQAAIGATQAATFRATSVEYLASQTFTPRHVDALQRILDRDLLPDLGALPIAEITTPQALAALRRIEARGNLETCAKARRLGSQIHRYGIAIGVANADPFATLARGVLKPPVVTNRATVPLKEFPALLKALRKVPAELNTRLACYWTLLTACRVGEMRLASWSEIDGDEWIIGAARMKMKHDHVVPLSKQAKLVLKGAATIRTSSEVGALLFPGFTRHGALSENALIALLARCGFYGRQTAHGFRAAFSTWGHEKAEAVPDVIECCLAHVVPGVRGKYNRALYLRQRRALLQAWADQCEAWGMKLP